MSIGIRLDHAAVNALFPEGSTARVELQNVVIAQFTRTIFAKHLPETAVATIKAESDKMAGQIAAAITDARTTLVAQAQIDNGLVKIIKSNGYGTKDTAALTPEATEMIKNHVNSAVNVEFEALAKAAIDARVEKLLTLENRFDTYIDRKMAELLNAALVKKLNAALASAA